MPKIRGFKPDMWTDDTFTELSAYARLLWMGLWSYACDNGHLDDKSKQIKMRVLPTDDVNVAELLRELESHGVITRANGIITIPNFAKHQKPDKRYFQTCDAPGCVRPDKDSQPETRGGHYETTTSARGGHGVGSWGPHVDGEVKGSDGDSDGEGRTPERSTSARKKPARHLPQDFAPKPEHHQLASELGVDLRFEFAKFRDYWTAEGKPKVDWDATLRNWIRNARPSRPPLRLASTGEPVIPFAPDDIR